MEKVQQKFTDMINGLENITYLKGGRNYIVHSREEKARKALICIPGNNREDRGNFFMSVHDDQTRGKKVLQGKFCLVIWKQFFIATTSKHCNTLPREVVEYPSLEIFKNQLDKTPDNLRKCFQWKAGSDDLQKSL